MLINDEESFLEGDFRRYLPSRFLNRIEFSDFNNAALFSFNYRSKLSKMQYFNPFDILGIKKPKERRLVGAFRSNLNLCEFFSHSIGVALKSLRSIESYRNGLLDENPLYEITPKKKGEFLFSIFVNEVDFVFVNQSCTEIIIIMKDDRPQEADLAKALDSLNYLNLEGSFNRMKIRIAEQRVQFDNFVNSANPYESKERNQGEGRFRVFFNFLLRGDNLFYETKDFVAEADMAIKKANRQRKRIIDRYGLIAERPRNAFPFPYLGRIKDMFFLGEIFHPDSEGLNEFEREAISNLKAKINKILEFDENSEVRVYDDLGCLSINLRTGEERFHPKMLPDCCFNYLRYDSLNSYNKFSTALYSFLLKSFRRKNFFTRNKKDVLDEYHERWFNGLSHLLPIEEEYIV